MVICQRSQPAHRKPSGGCGKSGKIGDSAIHVGVGEGIGEDVTVGRNVGVLAGTGERVGVGVDNAICGEAMMETGDNGDGGCGLGKKAQPASNHILVNTNICPIRHIGNTPTFIASFKKCVSQ
jgi:hypothetical protein